MERWHIIVIAIVIILLLIVFYYFTQDGSITAGTTANLSKLR